MNHFPNKLIALVLAFILMLGQIPSGFATVPSTLHFPSGESTSFNAIQLDPKLGSVEEVSGAGPLSVILIQDAHEIPEAQRQIEKIVLSLQKQYSISRVAMEGSSGDIDAQFFQSFPDQKKLRDVFDHYYELGELTGGNGAAIFSSEMNRAVHFFGVEDWALYEKGLSLYRQAMRRQDSQLESFQRKESALLTEKKKIYAAGLLEADQTVSKFYEDQESLEKTIKTLALFKPPAGSIKLLLEDQKLGTVQSTEIERNLRFLLKELRDKQQFEKVKILNAAAQDFHNERISAVDFAFILKDVAAKTGYVLKFSAELSRQVKTLHYLRNIQTSRFFEDLETYIRESLLLGGNREEDLFRRQRILSLQTETNHYRLIKKLIQLELTRNQWMELKKSGVSLTSYPDQVNFYLNSESREAAFFENLKINQGPVIFIAGGFHAQGMIEIFRRNSVSYARISPEIGKVPNQTAYRAHLEGKISWAKYFHSKDGKINLYEAFLRGVRDQLLRVQSGEYRVQGNVSRDSRHSVPITPNSVLLKQWRDQILRDLASKDKLFQAEKYTAFLDELTTDGRNYLERKKLEDRVMLEKINRFTRGLKDLENRGALNQNEIFQLLERMHLPTVTAASLSSSNRLSSSLVDPILIERNEIRSSNPALDILPDHGVLSLHPKIESLTGVSKTLALNRLDQARDQMRLIAEDLRRKGQKQLIGITFAMFHEARRIKRSSEDPLGEDFLRVKIAQLEALFAEYRDVLDWVLVAVDDGDLNRRVSIEDARRDSQNTDHYVSGTLAQQIAAEYSELTFKAEDGSVQPKVQVLFLSKEKGVDYAEASQKGGSIYLGLRHLLGLGAHQLIYCDADLSSDLTQIPLILKPLMDAPEKQMVIGSRWVPGAILKGRSLAALARSKAYSVAVRMILGLKVQDPQNGFQALTASFAEWALSQVKDTQFTFATELELLAKIRTGNTTLTEVPMVWVDSPNASTVHVKDGLIMYQRLWVQRDFYLKHTPLAAQILAHHDILRSEMRSEMRTTLPVQKKSEEVVISGMAQVSNRIVPGRVGILDNSSMLDLIVQIPVGKLKKENRIEPWMAAFRELVRIRIEKATQDAAQAQTQADEAGEDAGKRDRSLGKKRTHDRMTADLSALLTHWEEIIRIALDDAHEPRTAPLSMAEVFRDFLFDRYAQAAKLTGAEKNEMKAPIQEFGALGYQAMDQFFPLKGRKQKTPEVQIQLAKEAVQEMMRKIEAGKKDLEKRLKIMQETLSVENRTRPQGILEKMIAHYEHELERLQSDPEQVTAIQGKLNSLREDLASWKSRAIEKQAVVILEKMIAHYENELVRLQSDPEQLAEIQGILNTLREDLAAWRSRAIKEQPELILEKMIKHYDDELVKLQDDPEQVAAIQGILNPLRDDLAAWRSRATIPTVIDLAHPILRAIDNLDPILLALKDIMDFLTEDPLSGDAPLTERIQSGSENILSLIFKEQLRLNYVAVPWLKANYEGVLAKAYDSSSKKETDAAFAKDQWRKFEDVLRAKEEAFLEIQRAINGGEDDYHNLNLGDQEDASDIIWVIEGVTNAMVIDNVRKKYGSRIKAIVSSSSGGFLEHWILIMKSDPNAPMVFVVDEEKEQLKLHEALKNGKGSAKPGDEIVLEIRTNDVHGRSQLVLNPGMETREKMKKEARKTGYSDGIRTVIHPVIPGRLFNQNVGLSRARSEMRQHSDGIGLTRTEDMSPRVMTAMRKLMGIHVNGKKNNGNGIAKPKSVLAASARDKQQEQFENDLKDAMRDDFLALLSSPDAGAEVTVRTLDLWTDKGLDFLSAVEDRADEWIRDKKNPITGFHFYTNTVIGQRILEIQVAALLEAHARLNHPAKLKIMFPMIRTEGDASFLGGKIIGQAANRANNSLREDFLSRGRLGQNVEWGAMIENLEAVQNLEAILKTDHSVTSDVDAIRRLRFSFISIGSNDLEEDVVSGLVGMRVTRNHPMFDKFRTQFGPQMIVALRKIVETAYAGGQSISICGDLAGHKVFLPLAEYWSRKGIKVAISTDAGRLPEIRHLARILSRKDLVKDEELNQLFDAPNYATAQKSGKLVNDKLEDYRDLLTHLADWNTRYRDYGGEHAFEGEIDYQNGMGGLKEYGFLKAIMRSLAKFGVVIPLSSGDEMRLEDLNAIVDFLKREKVFFENESEEFQKIFLFLIEVQKAIASGIDPRDSSKLTAKLNESQVVLPHLFEDDEITDVRHDFSVDEFRSTYSRASRFAFDSVVRLVHELCISGEKPPFIPEILSEHDLEQGSLHLIHRRGLRFSREKGFVEETTWEVNFVQNWEAMGQEMKAERGEIYLMRIFERAALEGEKLGARVHVGHDAQKAIRLALSDPLFRSNISKPSEKQNLKSLWWHWLRINANLAYGDARFHYFGLWGLFHPEYAHAQGRPIPVGERFTPATRQLQVRQMLESLPNMNQPCMRLARDLFLSLRTHSEGEASSFDSPIQLLRLAAYVGSSLSEGKEPFKEVERRVREVLPSWGITPNEDAVSFDEIATSLSWIFFLLKEVQAGDQFQGGNISEEKQIQSLKHEIHNLQTVHLSGKIGQTTPAVIVQILFLLSIADRYVRLDPDARALVMREGAGSPLEKLNELYILLSNPNPEDPQDVKKGVVAVNARLEGLEAHWLGESNVRQVRSPLPGERSWSDLLDDYLDESGFSRTNPGLAGERVQLGADINLKLNADQFDFWKPFLSGNEEGFKSFFAEYTSFFGLRYAMALDRSTLRKQLVIFRLLQLLQRQKDPKKQTFLVLATPLPLHSHSQAAFEIFFLSPRQDNPVLPILTSGLTFWSGFSTDVAQRRFETTKSSANLPYSYVKHLGHYPKPDPGSLEAQATIPLDRVQTVLQKHASELFRRQHQPRQMFEYLDGLFPMDLPETHPKAHVVKKMESVTWRVITEVIQEETQERNKMILDVTTQERRGGLYALLKRLYVLGYDLGKMRFDNTVRDRIRVQVELLGRENVIALGVDETRRDLIDTLEQSRIFPGAKWTDKIPMIKPVRSEIRQERGEQPLQEQLSVARELLSYFKGDVSYSRDFSVSRLKNLATQLHRWIQASGIEQVENHLIEGMQLQSETQAEAMQAIRFFMHRFREMQNHEGPLGMAFTDSDHSALSEALQQISLNRGTLIFLPSRFRPSGPAFSKLGFQVLFSKPDKNSTRGLLNEKAIPVVGENSDQALLAENLFGVGFIQDDSFRQDPNLQLVAKVVQMLAALIVAEKINKVSDLEDPLMRAGLLKALFLAYPHADQILRFGPRGFSIHGAELRAFIDEVILRKTLEYSA